MAASKLTSKPKYKNLKVLDGGVPVMRYMSLAQLVSVLVKSSLPLTRVDRFRDKFEGSVPKRQVDDQIPIFSDESAQFFQDEYTPPTETTQPKDMNAEVARWRRALARSAHASCWRWGPESEGMWRLYCGEREGVALKTTFSRLEASVAGANLLVGRVQYWNYAAGAGFTDDLDALMFKREGFDFEQEVRLLHVDEPHYRKLQQDETSAADLPERIALPWSVHDAVEKVLVSPYADDMYLAAVEATVSALSPKIELSVARSELWGEPWR